MFCIDAGGRSDCQLAKKPTRPKIEVLIWSALKRLTPTITPALVIARPFDHDSFAAEGIMASVLNKYCPIDERPSEEDLTVLSPPSGVPTFSLPPISNPTSFLRSHIDDHKNPDCRIKLAHGTTTLAFRFNGGIVVAVDSRATAGSWIASQTVKKGASSNLPPPLPRVRPNVLTGSH